LEEISFTVADGEFCVLLGPSGCGKTTLLRIVAGLESASGGTVDIDTTRVDLLPPQERDVAFVFQNYALYPHMTVFENLGFSLRLHGVVKEEIQTRVTEVARLLEIDNQLNHKPQQLSVGKDSGCLWGGRLCAGRSFSLRRASVQSRCDAAGKHARGAR